MAKSKTETIEQYEVLIDCHNNKTGKDYKAGDIVTGADFPKAVIDNWLALDPPVLKVVN